MITITERPEGLILAVRAQPNARKSRVMGESAGALKVAVTAPPAEGRANEAILETLRAALGLKRSQIELFSGDTSRDKKVLVRGVGRAELEAKVMRLASG